MPLEFERLPEDESARALARVPRGAAHAADGACSSRRSRCRTSSSRTPSRPPAPRRRARTSSRGRSSPSPTPSREAPHPEAAEEEERRSYEGRMPAEWLDALGRSAPTGGSPTSRTRPYVIVVFEQAYGIARRRLEGQALLREGVRRDRRRASCSPRCTDAGLATLTHTPSPMGFLRELLERPENERPYVLVPVGYPADGCDVPDHRAEAARRDSRPALTAPQAVASGSRVSSRFSKSRRIASPLESTVSYRTRRGGSFTSGRCSSRSP